MFSFPLTSFYPDSIRLWGDELSLASNGWALFNGRKWTVGALLISASLLALVAFQLGSKGNGKPPSPTPFGKKVRLIPDELIEGLSPPVLLLTFGFYAMTKTADHLENLGKLAFHVAVLVKKIFDTCDRLFLCKLTAAALFPTAGLLVAIAQHVPFEPMSEEQIARGEPHPKLFSYLICATAYPLVGGVAALKGIDWMDKERLRQTG